MISPPPTPSQRILRRVGVVGDIHCEDELLEVVLRYFTTQHADAILATGDVGDGVGDINRVCDLLVQHGVLTVKGNHDRWLLEGSMRDVRDATPSNALRTDVREWLMQLPKTISFQTTMGALLLCHGLGEDDMAGLRPHDDGYSVDFNLPLSTLVKSKQHRFVVAGHTHESMVRTIGGITIVNAGTLARGCRQGCSIIDFEIGTVQFLEFIGGRISKAERFQIT